VASGYGERYPPFDYGYYEKLLEKIWEQISFAVMNADILTGELEHAM